MDIIKKQMVTLIQLSSPPALGCPQRVSPARLCSLLVCLYTGTPLQEATSVLVLGASCSTIDATIIPFPGSAWGCCGVVLYWLRQLEADVQRGLADLWCW